MFWYNLFLVVCVWLFLPIQYAVMRNNTQRRNNLILSVTLPPEAQTDREVQDYCQSFRKKLLWVCAILTLTLVPALFFPWVSVSTTWTLAWMPIAIFVLFRTYGKGSDGLKALKRRRGWKVSTGEIAVETRSLKLPGPVKRRWFVIPAVLSVLPVISCLADDWDPAWKLQLAITAASCLLVNVTLAVYYGLVFRQRADAADENPDRTAALTRIRRYNWNKFALGTAWATAACSLACWLCQGNQPVYLAVTLLYTAVLIAASLLTEFAVRRAQQRLTAETSPAADEDDRWIWGQFYYNPDSPKTFIQERVGMGLSMNYAKPAGKIMAVISVLLLLSLPLLGGWLMVEELSPIRVTQTDSTVTVSQAWTTYQIDRDQVTEIQVLDRLPQSSRVWGTGMDTLLKGSFSVAGYGMAELCLNPENPPFVVIKTEKTTYIFNQKDIS